MELIPCPSCEYKIFSKLGTICPNCGFTIGYFDEDKRKKRYGKFFALSVIIPFISLTLLAIASLNKISLLVSFFIFIYLLIKSSPFLYNDIFINKFDKLFFYSIWFIFNSIYLLFFLNHFIKQFF